MRPRLSTLWRKNNLFSSPPLWSRYSPLIDVVLAYDQEDLYRRGRRLAKPGSRSIASRVSTATCHHASAVWRMVRRKGGHKSRLCMHASKKKIFPHETHSSCLLPVAAVINPSLLPWATAGGTIISLCNKAGDSTLVFIIHHSGQVFQKGWVIVELIGMDGVTPQAST